MDDVSTALARALDSELAAQGVRDEDLAASDIDFARTVLRGLAVRLRARQTWEMHLGELLTHAQVLALTGWSKQALSQATRDRRVLRLVGDREVAVYPLSVFDDAQPARPLQGIKPVLAAWAEADPAGWAAASWFVSPQPELDGRTPREALRSGEAERVVALARHAAARLVP
jgi:hypothetical protein